MRNFLLAFFIAFVLFPIQKSFCQSISGGDSHSNILCNSGSLKGIGYNGYGQLGDGTYNDSYYTVSTNGLTGITAVSAGAYFSVALKNDGTVVGWGDNTYGQTTVPSGLSIGSGPHQTGPTPTSPESGYDGPPAWGSRSQAWREAYHGGQGEIASERGA